MVTARESTSLSIMWQLLSTTYTVSTYTISYSNFNNTECYNDSHTITDSMTLDNLEEATEYSIIVTATLSNSQSQQDNTSATTLPAGIYVNFLHNYYASCYSKNVNFFFFFFFFFLFIIILS